ncbi:MAG: tetratricopeptide repeat protein [Labilithrix sp.]|nr:tetratricopeptide repeat protein [Labilithrix sp.]MCW5837810.1 tetratricopeptide repeat protein [Labilithrix sp.]
MVHEVDEELREIKREIIESRGLVIKTNNLTNALSADIKSIAKRQQTYERRLSWNSATAYIVFVVVVFAALKLAWDARVDQIKAETEQRALDNDRLRKEQREAQKRDEDRSRAESRAAQFYELVRAGKRVEVVEQWEQVKKEPLSKAELAMFSDAVERARNDLAGQLYQQGMDKVRVQRWQEAATAFEESLKYKDDSAIGPSVRLGLSDSYRHLNRQREAIPILTLLAENAVDKEVHDDALYLLAWCQTDVQAWNDAKNTWRTLIRRFPESRFTAEAKLQLAQLQLMH